MKTQGILMMRVLAVMSAVVLAGGYVWYRQKMAESAKPIPYSASVLQGDESSEEELTGDAIDPFSVGDKTTIMPGPKSIRVWEPEDRPRTLLPGSKAERLPSSPSVAGEKVYVQPVDPDQEKKSRIILPGSKSIAPILEAPSKSEPREP